MTTEERLDKFLNKTPQVPESAWVAKSADVMGDVQLGEHASVFYGAILRGDIESIIIGEGSNIQDGTIIHLADDMPCVIGKYVTVGHGAMVHACTIEDECLIGMRSTVLDGAVIGKRSIVAAGAVVPPGMKVPPGSMVMGVPAKVKPLPEERQAGLKYWAEKYVTVSATHKAKQGGLTFA